MTVILDTHERRSGCAQILTAYLEQRLAEHREKNDNEMLTPDETTVLRGRIAELKHIQNLLATGES